MKRLAFATSIGLMSALACDPKSPTDTDGADGAETSGDATGAGGPCTDPEACQCLAGDDTWCVDWNESGSLAELTEFCDENGGSLISGGCPQEGLAGACLLADDCYSPDYYFYEDYAGGLPNYADLAQAEMLCSGCSIWSPG